VYSIVEYSSFSEIKQFYDKITRLKESQTVPIILVGNKADLDAHRTVPTEKGEALAKDLRAAFCEASAKTAHNVEHVFFTLVREIRKIRFPNGMNEKKKSGRRGCVLL
jgi:GTPase SAR1 family protein